ncbi:MAG: YafY family transcriptional regulator [Myxococcales bacterium]|nr:YafY family transcriptional regulator [Myxococcales bacterium]MCB9749716.1 YafY family transcriptional regulator [Myxococcales bacterium]
MRRADRLFQLVQLLRNRRFATAETLAAELGISKRTVYRDIRDLERSGVPIRGEVGVGYQLDRSFELPPMAFTAVELEALILGARFVETWGDRELAVAARGAMAKIEAVLPEPLRRAMERAAMFAPGTRTASDMGRFLGPLRRAIAARSKLRLAYTRADGQHSERTIRPLGLFYWGTSWSLGAWCELRRDYRNFRADRITGLEVLEEGFDADDDAISLSDFLDTMKAENERACAAWRAREEAARAAANADENTAPPSPADAGTMGSRPAHDRPTADD